MVEKKIIRAKKTLKSTQKKSSIIVGALSIAFMIDMDRDLFTILMAIIFGVILLNFYLKSFYILNFFEDRFSIGKNKKTLYYKFEKIKKINIRKVFIFGKYIEVEFVNNKKFSFLFYSFDRDEVVKQFSLYCSDKFESSQTKAYEKAARFQIYWLKFEKTKRPYEKSEILSLFPLFACFSFIFLSIFYLVYASPVNTNLPYYQNLMAGYSFVYMLLGGAISIGWTFFTRSRIARGQKYFEENFENVNYRELRKYFPTYKSALVGVGFLFIVIVGFFSSFLSVTFTIPSVKSSIVNNEKILKTNVIDFRYNGKNSNFLIKKGDIVYYYDRTMDLHVGITDNQERSTDSADSAVRGFASVLNKDPNAVYVISEIGNEPIQLNRNLILGVAKKMKHKKSE